MPCACIRCPNLCVSVLRHELCAFLARAPARCVLQFFWEAFPASTGPSDRTTYLFTYLDAQASMGKTWGSACRAHAATLMPASHLGSQTSAPQSALSAPPS